MNEFVARKLGEVLAFSQVGTETVERAKSALSEAFPDLDSIEGSLRSHAGSVEELAKSSDVWDKTSAKAEATGKKLRAMRDLYLAKPEDWDNPSELLEWLGFFEGAALAHWKLVLGAARKLEHDALATLSEEAVEFHDDILLSVGEGLSDVGAERA